MGCQCDIINVESFHEILRYLFNPNKAGLFEGSFFWGGGVYKPQGGLQTNHNCGHNILRFFDILASLLSSQVKQSVIISNRHGIYVLPRKLLNDLRLRILGN